MLVRDIPLALTFDDVLLVPGESHVLPRQVDLGSALTADLRMSVPLLSSAMDTVTEGRTAIAMARLGGLGVVHKNLTIERQASEIRTVKRAVSGTVLDPVTVPSDQPVRRARALMREHGISGLPVVDNMRVTGIVTNRDLRFEQGLDRPIRDVMSTQLITVGPDSSVEACKALLQKHKIEKLLVVDDEGRLSRL